MDEIPVTERWEQTKRFIVERLHENFDIMEQNDKSYRERIDELMEAIAKDTDMNVEAIKEFLLLEKIVLENERQVERIARHRKQVEKIMGEAKIIEVKTGKVVFDMKEQREIVEKEMAKAKKMQEAYKKK